MRKAFLMMLTIIIFIAFGGRVLAHVPYLEEDDFTEEDPFQVKSIEQSIVNILAQNNLVVKAEAFWNCSALG